MQAREHRQVVQVVASGKHVFGGEAEPARQLGQGGALVVSLVTEAGIHVVSHHRQVGDAAGVFGQIIVDGIGVAIIAGDQTERRIGVFVNSGMEAGVDPGDDARQVRLHPGKQFRVRAAAGRIPIFQPQVLGVLVQVNFPLDQHQVIRLDGNARSPQGLHEAGHVPASVDDPFGAAGLQFADELLQVLRNRGAFELGEQRAVEIG